MITKRIIGGSAIGYMFMPLDVVRAQARDYGWHMGPGMMGGGWDGSA